MVGQDLSPSNVLHKLTLIMYKHFRISNFSTCLDLRHAGWETVDKRITIRKVVLKLILLHTLLFIFADHITQCLYQPQNPSSTISFVCIDMAFPPLQLRADCRYSVSHSFRYLPNLLYPAEGLKILTSTFSVPLLSPSNDFQLFIF
jgi:hypothetical protein